jgi:ATP-dependent Clp protease ATP-binding subunit ClpC
VVNIMISRIETQLRNKDMGLELTDNSERFLANKGYDPVLGARPLRRHPARNRRPPVRADPVRAG